jgi:hypothetical protein
LREGDFTRDPEIVDLVSGVIGEALTTTVSMDGFGSAASAAPWKRIAVYRPAAAARNWADARAGRWIDMDSLL